MVRTHFALISLFSATILLAGCQSWQNERDQQLAHRAACNTLKSRIVFSGSTGNSRQAEIQNAEAPLTERNYDQNCENK